MIKESLPYSSIKPHCTKNNDSLFMCHGKVPVLQPKEYYQSDPCMETFISISQVGRQL